VIAAPDADSVLAAVRRCWLALVREPLRSYLRLAGEQITPSLAVLVQALVETDVGGVLFTRGAGGAVLIEACWGMSHGVTGDLVQPARYMLDRTTGRVLEAASRTPRRCRRSSGRTARRARSPRRSGTATLCSTRRSWRDCGRSRCSLKITMARRRT